MPTAKPPTVSASTSSDVADDHIVSSKNPAPLPVHRVFALAAWFGLATALIELTGRAAQKFLLEDIIRLSPQIVWMTPVGELMLFLSVALGLVLISLRWPWLRSFRAVVVVCSFLACFALFIVPSWLNTTAALLLAIGVSWQVGRTFERRSRSVYRWARRTLPVFGGIVLALAIGLNGWLFLRERHAVAGLPTARRSTNVVLIIWDTVRATSVSLLGHSRATTPNLERLARRGVSFELAIAPASWTLPSHASMFTGRPPHEVSVNWIEPLDDTYPTIAETLRGKGYLTAGFVANTLYADREHGLDRGFDHYEDYRISIGQVFASTGLGHRVVQGHKGWYTGRLPRLVGYAQIPGRKMGATLTRDFLRWLDRTRQRERRPFFAFLNYFDAHQPYLPPEPFAGRFTPAREPTTILDRVIRELERPSFWELSAEEIQAETAAYEAAIAYMDNQLAIVLDELEARGELDNTVVIVTSDHGEAFGEHGSYEHGRSLHLEEIHVPLVIASPGQVPEGRVVAEAVSVRNLAATIEDLTNGSDQATLSGTTLARWWTDSVPGSLATAELTPDLDEKGRIATVVTRDWQYIRNADDNDELYDLTIDPMTAANRVALDGGLQTAALLDGFLEDAIVCTGRRCRLSSSPQWVAVRTKLNSIRAQRTAALARNGGRR